MSRTQRRDHYDNEPRKVFMMFGDIVDTAPTKKELRKMHADGKKTYKPGRRAKQYLSKGAKAKTKRELSRVVEEPDEAPLPKRKNTHVWDWN